MSQTNKITILKAIAVITFFIALFVLGCPEQSKTTVNTDPITPMTVPSDTSDTVDGDAEDGEVFDSDTESFDVSDIIGC